MSDVLHAAAAIRMLLQQSYFVPFALACFSALARIQVPPPTAPATHAFTPTHHTMRLVTLNPAASTLEVLRRGFLFVTPGAYAVESPALPCARVHSASPELSLHVIALVVQVLLSQLLVDTVHAHNLATELGIQQPASSASTAAPPAALRCCWSDDGVPTVTAVGDAAVQAAVGAAGGMGDEDLGTCVVVARATTTVRGADESGCAGGRTNTSSNNTAGFPVMEVSATGARWRREAAGGEVRVDIAQGGVTGCADTPRTHNAGCGTMTKVPMGEATAVCGEGGDEAVAAAQDRGTQQAVQSLDSIDVGTAGGAAAVVAAAGVATTGAAAKKRRKADRWLQQLQTGGGESETRKRAKKKAAPEDAIDDIFAMLTKGKGKQ
jgi:hypothetical protein